MACRPAPRPAATAGRRRRPAAAAAPSASSPHRCPHHRRRSWRPRCRAAPPPPQRRAQDCRRCGQIPRGWQTQSWQRRRRLLGRRSHRRPRCRPPRPPPWPPPQPPPAWPPPAASAARSTPAGRPPRRGCRQLWCGQDGGRRQQCAHCKGGCGLPPTSTQALRTEEKRQRGPPYRMQHCTAHACKACKACHASACPHHRRLTRHLGAAQRHVGTQRLHHALCQHAAALVRQQQVQHLRAVTRQQLVGRQHVPVAGAVKAVQ